MAPAWNQLGGDYKDHPSVLIADVDCTIEGELCQKHGVRGYPTIKYYTDETASDGDTYSGGRTYEALKKFAEDTLEPKCTVADPVKCTEKEKAYIEKMKGKSADDLKSGLERLEKMKGDKMKGELKAWVNQRARILKQLSES